MIDVVLPCFIRSEEILELTKTAIESLGKVRLIVIDNASSVGGGYLRSVSDVYIRNRENLGYAISVNQGLKLSKSEYITIANNDIVASSNWQKIAIEIFKEDPNAYSIHPRMIPYDEEFRYGSLTVNTGMERWCTSSFFTIRTQNPQLYDENFMNSYDDWDYWLRIRKQGLHTVFTQKSCYKHKQSSIRVSMPKHEESERKNKEYFTRKWGGTAEELFAKEFPEQMKREYREGFLL